MTYPSSGNLSGRWTLPEVVHNIRNKTWIQKDDMDASKYNDWCGKELCNPDIGPVITDGAGDTTLCLPTGIINSIDSYFGSSTHPSGDPAPSPLDLKVPRHAMLRYIYESSFFTDSNGATGFFDFPKCYTLTDFNIEVWYADFLCGTGIAQDVTFPENRVDDGWFLQFSPSGWLIKSSNFIPRISCTEDVTPGTSGPPTSGPPTSGPPTSGPPDGETSTSNTRLMQMCDALSFAWYKTNPSCLTCGSCDNPLHYAEPNSDALYDPSASGTDPYIPAIQSRWRRLYEDWTISETQYEILTVTVTPNYYPSGSILGNGMDGISSWSTLPTYEYSGSFGSYANSSMYKYHGPIPSDSDLWNKFTISSGYLNSMPSGCYWFPYLRQSVRSIQYDPSGVPELVLPSDDFIVNFDVSRSHLDFEDIISTPDTDVEDYAYYSGDIVTLDKKYANFYQSIQKIDIIQYCPSGCQYSIVTDEAIESSDSYTYKGSDVGTYTDHEFCYKQTGSCRAEKYIGVIVSDCPITKCEWQWDGTGQVAGFPAWFSQAGDDPCPDYCQDCQYPSISGTYQDEILVTGCNPLIYSGVLFTANIDAARDTYQTYLNNGYDAKIVWWPFIHGEDINDYTPIFSGEISAGDLPALEPILGEPPAWIINLIEQIHETDYALGCNQLIAQYSGFDITWDEDAYRNFNCKGLFNDLGELCLGCLTCSSGYIGTIQNPFNISFVENCREPDPTLYTLDTGEIEYVTLSTCGQCTFGGLNVYDITDASGYQTDLAESEWGVPIDIDRPCNEAYVEKETFSLYFSARYGDRAVPVISGIWYDTSVYGNQDIFLITRQNSPEELRNWTCRYLRFASKTGSGGSATLNFSWPYNDLYWSYCTGTDVPINLVPC